MRCPGLTYRFVLHAASSWWVPPGSTAPTGLRRRYRMPSTDVCHAATVQCLVRNAYLGDATVATACAHARYCTSQFPAPAMGCPVVSRLWCYQGRCCQSASPITVVQVRYAATLGCCAVLIHHAALL
eukprot:1465105-Rhodomonas_salina.4